MSSCFLNVRSPAGEVLGVRVRTPYTYHCPSVVHRFGADFRLAGLDTGGSIVIDRAEQTFEVHLELPRQFLTL